MENIYWFGPFSIILTTTGMLSWGIWCNMKNVKNSQWKWNYENNFFPWLRVGAMALQKIPGIGKRRIILLTLNRTEHITKICSCPFLSSTSLYSALKYYQQIKSAVSRKKRKKQSSSQLHLRGWHMHWWNYFLQRSVCLETKLCYLGMSLTLWPIENVLKSTNFYASLWF